MKVDILFTNGTIESYDDVNKIVTAPLHFSADEWLFIYRKGDLDDQPSIRAGILELAYIEIWED